MANNEEVDECDRALRGCGLWDAGQGWGAEAKRTQGKGRGLRPGVWREPFCQAGTLPLPAASGQHRPVLVQVTWEQKPRLTGRDFRRTNA